MTFIKLRKSVRPVLAKVVLAPFNMVFTGLMVAWIVRYLLLIGLCAMFFSMWMAGQSFAGVLPDRETCVVLLLVMGSIWLVAIPLGISDYFQDGGYETVWRPTPGCREAVESHVEKLIAGEITDFYALLSPALQAELPEEELVTIIDHITQACGPFAALEGGEELEIMAEGRLNPDGPPDSDCLLQLQLRHANGTETCGLFYLNSREAFRIEQFYL
jgi:hypothetical protein